MQTGSLMGSMQRQRGLSVDYGKVICNMFGGIDWE
jgi:hypothetical protein